MALDHKPKSRKDIKDGSFDQFKVIAIVYSFTLLFFAAGVFLIWAGLSERRLSQSDNWKSTEAEVVEAKIVEVWNPRFKEHEPKVSRNRGIPEKVFNWEVKYVYFDSDNRHTGSDLWGKHGESKIELPAPPQDIPIYYQVNSPELSSLTSPADQKRESWTPLIMGSIFMMPFLLVVAFTAWYQWDKRKDTSRPSLASENSPDQLSGGESVMPRPRLSGYISKLLKGMVWGFFTLLTWFLASKGNMSNGGRIALYVVSAVCGFVAVAWFVQWIHSLFASTESDDRTRIDTKRLQD